MIETLPEPLARYALRCVVGARAPAYVRVGKNGRIVGWGGPLEKYGIRDLAQGATAVDRVPLLEGAIPASDEPVVLASVAIRGGRPVDVHVVPGAGEDWVLLLDASAATREKEIAYQSANDLALLTEAHERLRARRERESETLAALIALFDVALIERDAEGAFRVHEASPEWRRMLGGITRGESVEPGRALPSLHSFLVLATAHWTSAEPTSLRSGPLAEGERAFEAIACRAGDRALLVLVSFGA